MTTKREPRKTITQAEYDELMELRELKQPMGPPVEPKDQRPEIVMDMGGPRYRERPRASLSGCLMVIMAICLIGLTAFIVWDKLRSPAAPVSPVAPVVTPVNPALAVLVAPIAQKLTYEPDKARKVFLAYSGLRDAIDGPSGRRVTDSRIFAAVTTAVLSDIDAKGGTPIGRDIDQAVASHLGITWGKDSADSPEGWEFKQFTDVDRAKLVEILAAIAKAAEGTL